MSVQAGAEALSWGHPCLLEGRRPGSKAGRGGKAIGSAGIGRPKALGHAG